MAAAGDVRDKPVGGRRVVVSSAKQEKRAKRACDIIVNPSCYSPCWASHFTGPPFLCTLHPAERGRPTSLRRGEGLAAAVPGQREREERKAEVVVVVETRGFDCV